MRHHSLVLNARCKLIQLTLVYMLNNNARLARFRNDRCGQVLLCSFSDPYFVECTSCSKGFKHRMLACQYFLFSSQFFHCFISCSVYSLGAVHHIFDTAVNKLLDSRLLSCVI